MHYSYLTHWLDPVCTCVVGDGKQSSFDGGTSDSCEEVPLTARFRPPVPCLSWCFLILEVDTHIPIVVTHWRSEAFDMQRMMSSSNLGSTTLTTPSRSTSAIPPRSAASASGPPHEVASSVGPGSCNCSNSF